MSKRYLGVEFVMPVSSGVETMSEEYEIDNSSDALPVTDLEDGEVLQNAELVCVNQEEMDRLAAEEEAHEMKFSSEDFAQRIKRKGQELLRYHVVSCQDELEELRSQNASEDMLLVDPKEKLHLVKYVKIDGKIMKLWECGICSKDFRHQYTLMRHLPTHTDERKFVCDVCNKAFRQMSTLAQHRAIHSDARPYVCDVCQKTFNRVSTLIAHRRIHFEDKTHKCHICGKGFHQKGNLKNHLFSHSNERPYRCEICGRGFNQMSNLVVHKIKMHNQTSTEEEARPSDDKFACKLCEAKFAKKSLLTAHEDQVHAKSFKGSRTLSSRHKARTSESTMQAAVEAPASVMKTKHKPGVYRIEEGATAGLLIDAIQTPGMLEARNSNQTAFALLKSIDGAPSLVKIFDLEDNKQLLIPATSEDLAESARKSCGSDVSKTDQIKQVAVVATVSQQMDSNGQLVVRIESIDVDQKLLESIETPVNASEEQGTQDLTVLREANNDTFFSDELGCDEQVHFVRPLPDGGFEIVAEEDATNFLEIVDESVSHCEDASSSSSLVDSSQIIITQDEDGHLTLEGTPLHYLFDSEQQQQLQFIINSTNKKAN